MVQLETRATYAQYNDSRCAAEESTQRMDLISHTVRLGVAELTVTAPAFLLIDHIDQCSISLQQTIRHKLQTLQNGGLKILITSRLPNYEIPIHRLCDSINHVGDEFIVCSILALY